MRRAKGREDKEPRMSEQTPETAESTLKSAVDDILNVIEQEREREATRPLAPAPAPASAVPPFAPSH